MLLEVVSTSITGIKTQSEANNSEFRKFIIAEKQQQTNDKSVAKWTKYIALPTIIILSC